MIVVAALLCMKDLGKIVEAFGEAIPATRIVAAAVLYIKDLVTI